MKTKNPTNKERIESLEKEIKRLWEVLDEVAIQARRGESAWNFQRPIGPKFRDIPIPKLPEEIREIDGRPINKHSKPLRDRVHTG